MRFWKQEIAGLCDDGRDDLYEHLLLEAWALREKIFDLRDLDLLAVADALLLGLEQKASRHRQRIDVPKAAVAQSGRDDPASRRRGLSIV